MEKLDLPSQMKKMIETTLQSIFLAKTRNDRTVPTVILHQALRLGTEKTMILPKTVPNIIIK